ncbi:MAG: hypothetical protein AAF799_20445 [Myxococcota bacterium]
MRGPLLACIVGGLLGFAACLVDLEDGIACGDGFTDRDAGEDCDPGDPAGFVGLCGGQGGSCNPDTCQEECCGDQAVNGTEECDGIDLGFVGPGGDPMGGDSCVGLLIPGTQVAFTSGRADCRADCRYDLSECSLCGNGRLDPEFPSGSGTNVPAEVCDGDAFDEAQLSAQCRQVCPAPAGVTLECAFECAGCRLIELQEPAQCCIRAGSPISGSSLPCCCQLDPDGCDEPGLSSSGDPQCPGVKQAP